MGPKCSNSSPHFFEERFRVTAKFLSKVPHVGVFISTRSGVVECVEDFFDSRRAICLVSGHCLVRPVVGAYGGLRRNESGYNATDSEQRRRRVSSGEEVVRALLEKNTLLSLLRPLA